MHILGTDTDVGKTWLCVKMIQTLQKKGVSALPVKPIHSGWPLEQPWGEDLEPHLPFLQNLSWKSICAYRLVEPMSPHAAAKLEGLEIKMDHLKAFWKSLDLLEQEVLMIEGIGGVCCPLGPNLTYLDFLIQHQAPCLLVSRVGLGSLNHAIMSEKLLSSHGLKVMGLILNPEKDFNHDDLIYQHAKWELQQQVNCPVYGPLNRYGDVELLDPLMDQISRGYFD